MLLLTEEITAVLNAVFIVLSAILTMVFVPEKASLLPVLLAQVLAMDTTKLALI